MKLAKIVSESHRSGIIRVMQMLLFSCLVTVLAGVAFAIPPEIESCIQDDVYERLKCREKGLYDQMEELNLHIQEDAVFADTVTGKKKELTENIKGRAKESSDRSKAGHYKKQIRKARKAGNDNCYLIELDNDGIGNDDGVCELEYDEICAAESDTEKNCDPEAKKDKPNQGVYVCAERCEGESLPSTSEEEEQEIAMAIELENTYQIFEEQAQELNQNFDDLDKDLENSGLESSAMMSFGAAAGGCDVSPSTELTALTAIKYTSQVAFAVARGAEDVLLTVCGTSVLGNNTSFLCTIPEGLVATFAVANEGVDVAYNVEKELQNDKVTNCLIDKLNGIPTSDDMDDAFAASQEAIRTDTQNIVDAHNANIENKIKDSEENISAQIASLKDAMDKHAYEIKVLLSTPHGQRPDFPTKK